MNVDFGRRELSAFFVTVLDGTLIRNVCLFWEVSNRLILSLHKLVLLWEIKTCH